MKKTTTLLIPLFMALVIGLLINLNLWGPTKVLANKQQSLSYNNLSIYIMPQYSEPNDWEDKPAIFIGVYGTLKNNSENDSVNEISLPIVQADGDFHLHLVGDTVEDKIENITADFNAEKREVSWEPNEVIKPGDTYDFLVEYYISVDSKDNNYEITIPYELERNADIMDMLIFEPFNAENFNVESNVEKIETTDQFGIKVHKLEVGEAQAETTVDVTLLYEKSDNVTTMEAIEMLTEQAEKISEANEALAEKQASEEKTFFTVENIVMIAIAFFAIVSLIWFMTKNRRKNNTQ